MALNLQKVYFNSTDVTAEYKIENNGTNNQIFLQPPFEIYLLLTPHTYLGYPNEIFGCLLINLCKSDKILPFLSHNRKTKALGLYYED